MVPGPPAGSPVQPPTVGNYINSWPFLSQSCWPLTAPGSIRGGEAVWLYLTAGCTQALRAVSVTSCHNSAAQQATPNSAADSSRHLSSRSQVHVPAGRPVPGFRAGRACWGLTPHVSRVSGTADYPGCCSPCSGGISAKKRERNTPCSSGPGSDLGPWPTQGAELAGWSRGLHSPPHGRGCKVTGKGHGDRRDGPRGTIMYRPPQLCHPHRGSLGRPVSEVPLTVLCAQLMWGLWVTLPQEAQGRLLNPPGETHAPAFPS